VRRSSVIVVLTRRLIWASAFDRVASLVIPSARDEGRDQGGIIEGPSLRGSTETSMRSILNAMHAGSFPPRLTDVEACVIPVD
jgi:hypothetical protein